MRFSRRKRASDGGEDQDGDQDGGGSGQAQTGGGSGSMSNHLRFETTVRA